MTRRNLLFACAGFAAAMWSGCGFEFPPAPQPVPTPEPQARPVAYRIGVLDGVLADELEEGMQLVPHSGTASDKPIVIAAEELATLSAEQVTAIHAAYAANHPIVLVYASLNDIKALQQLLGNDAFEYALPDGVPYVEIYAVDRDADGSMWQWSLFPPESTATEYSESTVQDTESGTETTQTTPAQVVSLGYDSDADQNSRADMLFQWIAEDEQRMQTPAARTAKLQVAGAADELTEIGEAWIDQGNFQQSGNNYQISHFAWRLHSVSTGQDWFYVQQKCIFSASKAFTANERRHKGLYLNKIEIDAWMDRYRDQPAAVGLVQSSPQTANNQTQITSGVSWNIGGEVAVDTNGPSAKLNAGISISNSTTVTVQDCTVLDKSNDRGNNPHWVYAFKTSEIGSISDCFFQDCLTDVPNLAITSFQPMNQWIWRLAPEVRVRNAPMRVSCSVTLVDTTESWKFFYATRTHTYQTARQVWTINIPYPRTK